MHLKYVIIEIDGLEVGISFPSVVTHKSLVEGVLCFERRGGREARVVAAGFCLLDSWVTWGESESLRIGSRPGDGAVLKRSYPMEAVACA